MNSHLQYAYGLGALDARTAFEKGAAEGDALTSMLGAVPLAGPSLAGYASGRSTPFEPKEMGARTSAETARGQAFGGLGGAALGAGLGAGGVALAKRLGADIDMDPGQAALWGGLLGSGLGIAGGGAYGAYKGRRSGQEVAAGEELNNLFEAQQEDYQHQQQNLRILDAITNAHQMGAYGQDLQLQLPPQLAQVLQAQEGETPKLGAFTKQAAGEVLTPIAGAVHPLLAALVGSATAQPGERVNSGIGAGAGSFVGQLGGGLGGAALGGLGGYGLARLLDKDPGEYASGGASLGALLGTLGGGAYGAHRGREAGIEDLDQNRAKIIKALINKERALTE